MMPTHEIHAYMKCSLGVCVWVCVCGALNSTPTRSVYGVLIGSYVSFFLGLSLVVCLSLLILCYFELWVQHQQTPISHTFPNVGKCSINCGDQLAGTTGLGHTLPDAGGERVCCKRKIFSVPSIPEELVQNLIWRKRETIIPPCVQGLETLWACLWVTWTYNNI